MLLHGCGDRLAAEVAAAGRGVDVAVRRRVHEQHASIGTRLEWARPRPRRGRSSSPTAWSEFHRPARRTRRRRCSRSRRAGPSPSPTRRPPPGARPRSRCFPARGGWGSRPSSARRRSLRARGGRSRGRRPRRRRPPARSSRPAPPPGKVAMEVAEGKEAHLQILSRPLLSGYGRTLDWRPLCELFLASDHRLHDPLR